MVKAKRIEVERIENKDIIMAMTMTKTIITKIIIMRMRIKVGNRIKIKKR